jgi:hypothetical protein
MAKTHHARGCATSVYQLRARVVKLTSMRMLSIVTSWLVDSSAGRVFTKAPADWGDLFRHAGSPVASPQPSPSTL